nr:hypothetical protein Itr_chr14CG22930 [Ipomoea trifida]
MSARPARASRPGLCFRRCFLNSPLTKRSKLAPAFLKRPSLESCDRQKPSLGAPSRPRTLPAPGEASSSVPDPRLSSASFAPLATSSSDPNAPEADQDAYAPPATRKKMVFLNSEVV